VSPVKYKLGFYIPEDDSLHSRRRKNHKYYSDPSCFQINAVSLHVYFLKRTKYQKGKIIIIIIIIIPFLKKFLNCKFNPPTPNQSPPHEEEERR
jgi:hypothetical protein